MVRPQIKHYRCKELVMNHEWDEKSRNIKLTTDHTENTEMETAKGQFLVYQAEDGKLKLDVRFEDESVWLSQRLMAELFQKDVRTISEHIQNVYNEGELVPEATIRKFRIVQMEGKREVARIKIAKSGRAAATH